MTGAGLVGSQSTPSPDRPRQASPDCRVSCQAQTWAVPRPQELGADDDPTALEDLCRALRDAVRADGVAVFHGTDVDVRLLHAEPDALAELLRRQRAPGQGPAPPDDSSVLALPLLGRDRTWGTLRLYRADDAPWTDREQATARAFADAVATVLMLTGERDAWQRAWRAAQHTATHDHLTGLPNRGLLFDRLDHAIVNAARNGRAVAVLFVDVDDFKTVNDRYGHAVGDTTLVEVARRLGRTLRANDTLARLSGDEFVVVCEDMDVSTGQVHSWLSLLGERIFHELRRPPQRGERAIDVSVSIGAAVTTRECSAQALTNHADEAMYSAKRAGGGRLVVSRNRPAPRTHHWKPPDPAVLPEERHPWTSPSETPPPTSSSSPGT